MWIADLLAVLLLLTQPGAAELDDAKPRFVLRDVATEVGVTAEIVCGSAERKRFILEENGSGAALFDYDGDGDLDLYLVNGSTFETLRGEAPPVHNVLYRNDGLAPGGAWRFVDVTERAGVGDASWGFGAAVGDVDGDGDDDLYVTNYGPNVLYLNQGDGTFRDATAASGTGHPGWGQSAVFADLEGDGDLDLYVANNLVFDLENLPNGGKPCNYRGLDTACGPVGFPAEPDVLYRNDGLLPNGSVRFTDVSASSGIHAPEPRFGLGVVATDFDDDGRADLYVANDSGPNFLFFNRSNTAGLRFDEEAFFVGAATSGDGRFQAGMGVIAGDADGDGRPDLFVTNFSYDHNTLYRNLGELFQDTTYPSNLGGPSRLPMGWGTGFVDFDHDGDLDLYVANGHIYPEVDTPDASGADPSPESFAQPDQLFLNNGSGRFVEASERILRDGPRVSRGAAFGDLDNDGDMDLAVVELGAAPTLLRNELRGGVGGAHWLVVGLHGLSSSGEGARLWVTAGETTRRFEVGRGGSYGSSSDPRVHVGLGASVEVERVEVWWPSGGRRVYVGLPVDRWVALSED